MTDERWPVCVIGKKTLVLSFVKTAYFSLELFGGEEHNDVEADEIFISLE